MKETVCIVCPRGCKLRIDESGGDLAVTGNACRRGRDFAVSELKDPRRTICTTVRTAFPEVPVLPVRLSAEIPKARIFDVMREINAVTVESRVGRGDIIIKDVLSLGADVIASSNLLKEIQ